MGLSKRTTITIGMAVAVAASACTSSSDNPAAPQNGDAAAVTEAGSGKVVSLSGLIVEAPAFTPGAGVEECVLDSDPPTCATSGSDGAITIELPANKRTGLMLTPPDAIPTLSPILTHEEAIALVGRTGWINPAAGVIIPRSVAQATGGAIGVQFDESKGYVDFSAGQLNGGTVSVVGGTTATAWYLANGVPGLVGSIDGGAVPAGTSLYGLANLDPGTVTFKAEKNGEPCEWDPVTWPGTEPGTVTVPIRAGTWTRLFEAKCP